VISDNVTFNHLFIFCFLSIINLTTSRSNNCILCCQQAKVMKDQNYASHTRYVKGFHFILGSILILGTLLSVINIWLRCLAGDIILGPILLTVLFVCCLFLFWFSRQFAVTVQDRAIRAEETLRYFILTNKPLDSRITMAQIIALRFAPDNEFIILVDRAANEGLEPKEIKQAIKQWRADHHRA